MANTNKPIIIITGTPGVGKSTLAKYLSKKLKFHRLDISDHYKTLSTNYNSKKKCYDIDLKKFENLVKETIKNSNSGIIIDSHIAHLLPNKLITLCIVLTFSNLKKLKQRLQKRKYSKNKIQENIDSEIFQICLMEAQHQKHKLLVFDSAKLLYQVKALKKIKTIIK